MQPVNNSRIQSQTIPAHQKISGERGTSSSPSVTGKHAGALVLPADIVNLSSDRSLNLDSLSGKRPSVPVSSAEKKALRESFSIHV